MKQDWNGGVLQVSQYVNECRSRNNFGAKEGERIVHAIAVTLHS